MKPIAKKPIKKVPRCCYCDESLTGKIVKRGCCPVCYLWLYRQVRRGKTTIEQLINTGKWLSKKIAGRKKA